MLLQIKIFGTLLFISLGYIIFFQNYNQININFPEMKVEVKDSKKIIVEENFYQNKISNDQDQKIIDGKNTLNLLKETKISVKKNQTFSSILDLYIKSNKLKYEIINKVNDLFDLRKLKVGQKIIFYKNSLNKIVRINLQINMEEDIQIDILDKISVNKIILNKFVDKKSQEFQISESLYLDGIKNNVPQ